MQPEPTPNNQPAIADLVIADMEARKQLGIDRYGAPLQAFNGRDGLNDLYEELLDGANYIRQVIEEQAIIRGWIEVIIRNEDKISDLKVRYAIAELRKLCYPKQN